MAIKSQIRLQQLTGSLAVLKPTALILSGAGVLPAAAPGLDLEDVLKYYSQAISQINGNVEFGAADPGAMAVSLYPPTVGGIPSQATIGRFILALKGDGSPDATAIALTTNGAGNLTPSDQTIAVTASPALITGDVITLVDLAASTPWNHQYISFLVGADYAGGSGTIGSLTPHDLTNAASIAKADIDGEFKAAVIKNEQYATVRGGKFSSNDAMVIKSGQVNDANLQVTSTSQLMMQGNNPSRHGVTLNNIGAGTTSFGIGGAVRLEIDNAGAYVSGSLAASGAASLAALDTSGVVNLNNATDSTSTTTGALIVDGGVGMAKDLFIGENLDVTGTSALDGLVTMGGSATIATDLDVSGASGLAALDTSGVVNLNNATDSTSTTTGALIVDGGVGMAKDLFIGENLDVTGTSALDGLVTMGGSATIATDLDVGGTLSAPLLTHADLELTGSVNGLILAGEGNGILLSGSNGVVVLGGGVGPQAGAAFGFGGASEGGLLISQPGSGDGATFISNFSNTTSILEAINSNKTSIVSGQSTVFQYPVTASIPAQGDVLMTGGTRLVVGDSSTFPATAALNEGDVYVNGQLMVSGTASDYTGGNSDYKVHATSTLRFNFALSADDVVKFIDKS